MLGAVGSLLSDFQQGKSGKAYYIVLATTPDVTFPVYCQNPQPGPLPLSPIVELLSIPISSCGAELHSPPASHQGGDIGDHLVTCGQQVNHESNNKISDIRPLGYIRILYCLGVGIPQWDMECSRALWPFFFFFFFFSLPQ